MSEVTNQQPDAEIVAIGEVYTAVKQLEPEAQARVLSYVAQKLNISAQIMGRGAQKPIGAPPFTGDQESDSEGDLEGVSPAGRKWMTRNGFDASELGTIFSLGVDEIDLVAKSVPGTTKVQRMRNVFLLKGIAAYLGTGIAKFTHEQMKEACLHYDAFDAGHFANLLKSFSPDVSGGKDIGYTLTARGLSEATALVKEMMPHKAGE